MRLSCSFLVGTVVLVCFAPPVSAQPAKTGQFIAKQYTEVFGRLPDQSGWGAYVSYFNTNGCNWDSVWQLGRGFLLSTEFNNLGYDNASKVLVLYRAILNRDPDNSGYYNELNLLNTGQRTFQQLVDDFYASTEFKGNTLGDSCGNLNGSPGVCKQICTAVPRGTNADPTYSFGSSFPISIPTTPTSGLPVGCYGGLTQDLLNCINNTSGNVVTLAQKAVYLLNNSITLDGKTLKTYGNPTHYQYAKQARLVRNGLTIGGQGFPLVILKGGSGTNNSTLSGIWIDGQRQYFGKNGDAQNVQIQGGYSTVTNCVLSNTAGFSTLQALGTLEGLTCPSSTINANLITAYSTSHYNDLWADGLTISCNNASVTSNEIVDATDVAIVLFHPGGGNNQHSLIQGNYLLSAGNSGFAGGGFETGSDASDPSPDYTGASFTGNTLWSGTYSHFDIGICVGAQTWGTDRKIGHGLSVTNNTTGTQTLRVTCGIVVDGMTSVTVQGNTFSTLVATTRSPLCPIVGFGADYQFSGHASGSIQSADYTGPVHQCVGH